MKKHSLSHCRISLAALLFAAAGPLSAHAASVAIANAGFEDPALADGASAPGAIPSWQGGGDIGVLDPSLLTFLTIPDGENAGFVRTSSLDFFGSVEQPLAEVLTAGNTYTLTMQVGASLTEPFGEYGVFLSFQPLSGPPETLAFRGNLFGNTGPVPAPGSFVPVVVSYTATAGDPNLGRTLRIGFTGFNTSGSGTTVQYLDGATLTTEIVPEPASALLLVGGAALLGLRRRRAAMAATGV